MNVDEVKAFMKEVGWGYLATTDGEKVGVRPMGGWAWVEGELWCASGKPSDKVAQLEKVPHAEYCFCSKDGRHARIAGSCTVSTDQEDKSTLYELVPALKDHISDPTSPEYVVLRLKPDRIRMTTTDMSYTEIKPE